MKCQIWLCFSSVTIRVSRWLGTQGRQSVAECYKYVFLGVSCKKRVTCVTCVTRQQEKTAITGQNGVAESRQRAPNASPMRHLSSIGRFLCLFFRGVSWVFVAESFLIAFCAPRSGRFDGMLCGLDFSESSVAERNLCSSAFIRGSACILFLLFVSFMIPLSHFSGFIVRNVVK